MQSFRNPNASTERKRIQMNLEEIDKFVLDLVETMDNHEIDELSASLKNLCNLREREQEGSTH